MMELISLPVREISTHTGFICKRWEGEDKIAKSRSSSRINEKLCKEKNRTRQEHKGEMKNCIDHIANRGSSNRTKEKLYNLGNEIEQECL